MLIGFLAWVVVKFHSPKKMASFFQEQLWNAVLVNGGDEEVLACGVGWTWASGLVWWLVRGDLLGLFNHLLGLFTNLLVTIPTKMGEQKPICWILCSLFFVDRFFLSFLLNGLALLVSWVSVFFICGWPIKPFYSFITLAHVLALMFEKIRLPHWMVFSDAQEAPGVYASCLQLAVQPAYCWWLKSCTSWGW